MRLLLTDSDKILSRTQHQDQLRERFLEAHQSAYDLDES